MRLTFEIVLFILALPAILGLLSIAIHYIEVWIEKYTDD